MFLSLPGAFVLTSFPEWDPVITTLFLYTCTKGDLWKHNYSYSSLWLNTCQWVFTVQRVIGLPGTPGSLMIQAMPIFQLSFSTSAPHLAPKPQFSALASLVSLLEMQICEPTSDLFNQKLCWWGSAICALINLQTKVWEPLTQAKQKSPWPHKESGNSYSFFRSQFIHHLFHEVFSAFTWQRLPLPPWCPHDLSIIKCNMLFCN